ncbi:MAG: hypothetical protein AAGF23_19250 [Acidobacteriota bacterium]
MSMIQPKFQSQPCFLAFVLGGLLSTCGLVVTDVSAETGVALLGDELRVNTYVDNNQSFPEIAVAPDGSAVVTWESIGQDGSNHAVAAQRYNPDGTPRGAEFIVNTETEDTQSQPSVAMAADGSFIIFWRSKFQDGSEFGLYAQRYGASGAPVGGEFRVSVATDGNQEDAHAAFDADGNMLVAYQSPDSASSGVFARLYDAAGQPGDEFRVNDTTGEWQQDPEVIATPGGFVVAWASRQVDADNRAILLKRYSADGTPVGDEQQVNTTEVGDQRLPGLAARPDGTFAVVWESLDQDGSDAAAIARIYDPSGAPVTGEIQLNQTTADAQENLAVAYDGRGGFVVVWDGDAPSGGSFDEIWGRRLLASGALDGDEFRINTHTTNRQVFPAIAAGQGGELMAVWHSWTGDGSGTSVAGQRLRITGVFEDGFETGDTSAWSRVVTP